ncbi:hypothetical protein ABK040_014772 [Willaertia magna]
MQQGRVKEVLLETITVLFDSPGVNNNSRKKRKRNNSESSTSLSIAYPILLDNTSIYNQASSSNIPKYFTNNFYIKNITIINAEDIEEVNEYTLYIKLLNENNILTFHLNKNYQYNINLNFKQSIELYLFKTNNSNLKSKIKVYINGYKIKHLLRNENNNLLMSPFQHLLGNKQNTISSNNISQNSVDNNNGINIDKYLFKRKQLFSKFSEGIQLEGSSWYEITPEPISEYIANCSILQKENENQKIIVIDGFCGVGGNLIQFLLQEEIDLVIGCEISEKKLECLQHNANIYGCDLNKLRLCNGDFMQQFNTFKQIIYQYLNTDLPLIEGELDMNENELNEAYNKIIKEKNVKIIAFLAPPYGFDYQQVNIYNIKYDMLINNGEVNGIDIYEQTKLNLNPNQLLYLLPKNVNIYQIGQQLHCNENNTYFEALAIEGYRKVILLVENCP